MMKPSDFYENWSWLFRPVVVSLSILAAGFMYPDQIRLVYQHVSASVYAVIPLLVAYALAADWAKEMWDRRVLQKGVSSKPQSQLRLRK